MNIKTLMGISSYFLSTLPNYGFYSYRIPCAIIAFATFINPATLAPFT